MRLLASLSSIFMLLAVSASGQSGNPAGMTPGTGPEQPNNADRLFVRAAWIGGTAEVEFGGIAQQKAESNAVKDFARRMVEDHSKANDRLISLAKEAGIPVPDELDQQQKAMRQRLITANGAECDLAYLQGQVIEHQKTVQLLEYEIGSGQDTDLKSFAAEILPIVLQHLRAAQALQAEMTGKAV
jgi:putative membrane protein